jgi:hypothetical protein
MRARHAESRNERRLTGGRRRHIAEQSLNGKFQEQKISRTSKGTTQSHNAGSFLHWAYKHNQSNAAVGDHEFSMRQT